MSARDAAIYRKAARIAHEQTTCGCWAIRVACQGDATEWQLISTFGFYYRPDHWPTRWFGKVTRGSDEQNFRVLALCFMAAIAEDEE